MNAKKSVLFPSQRTVFLGVHLDSIQMQACLAPARISNFTACLALFKLGHHVSVGTCHRLLGLMAADSPVLPLGLKELRLHPMIHPYPPLLQWRDPAFLQSGLRMGAVHRRHMITTDASMTGWGAVFEGRPASGEWTGEFLFWHINCLELRAVFLALMNFLPVLGEHHIIVRMDNMTVVSHINRQGGVHGRALWTGLHAVFSFGPRTSSFLWGQFTFRECWTLRPIFCRDRNSGWESGCWTVRWYPRYGICLAKRKWTSLLLKSRPNARSGSP